ncbi:hypothetical protein [Gemmatimonas groenlandica]|uniref:Uncharacterized protein n=1 Tax=Gemmatimonas groenlandica TaxID=2732249 RepID=A0A6M4IK46_9BACT|nr:hypothetical protein [Gemmatimonas groenlandica]QJR34228.1 hypothetical protein HKW67_01200 [Gemmatimonas groenlandica]
MIVHGSALLSSAPMLTVATVQDTAGKVAYVPKVGGPPDSSGYMWAGYAIVAVTYGGYIVLLLRRMARAKRGR